MNEITKVADQRQALRWLSRELSWERVLSGLRDVDAVVATVGPASRAA